MTTISPFSSIIFAACDPSSDVDGDDDKMDFSAVSRLTALCVYGPGHEGSRSFINVTVRGVMHRDAAPRNMMMLYDDRTGRYMVIDLELSEPIDGGVPELRPWMST
ncbi:hypothetical protein E4U47_005470 [Claviceps purpurea]|nr:hypothetical protein E4U47_005470 [Claviceps purpurea]